MSSGRATHVASLTSFNEPETTLDRKQSVWPLAIAIPLFVSAANTPLVGVTDAVFSVAHAPGAAFAVAALFCVVSVLVPRMPEASCRMFKTESVTNDPLVTATAPAPLRTDNALFATSVSWTRNGAG